MFRSTRPWLGRISTLRVPVKWGRSARAAEHRPRHRARRSRPGPVRGGLTTKLHLACEAGQRPLSLLVTAGQAGDSAQSLEAIRVHRTGRGRPRLWLPGTAAGIEDVAAAERAAGLCAEAER